MRLTHTFLSVFRSVHFLENHKKMAESALFELFFDLILVLDDLWVVILFRDNYNWHLKSDDF